MTRPSRLVAPTDPVTLQRIVGGKLIALMRPSLPLGWFDLCVIPQHDRPPARANVVATRGVLNTACPSPERAADKGLFLIGGPSKHHGWDTPGLLAQIDAILADTPTMRWTLTTSRRTPPIVTAAAASTLGWVLAHHDAAITRSRSTRVSTGIDPESFRGRQPVGGRSGIGRGSTWCYTVSIRDLSGSIRR